MTGQPSTAASELHAGPCVVCGLRNYPLSFGGPTICPACDCGNSGPQLVRSQKHRIAELESALSRLSAGEGGALVKEIHALLAETRKQRAFTSESEFRWESIVQRARDELVRRTEKFSEHTKAVESFLSDLYCTMVDPCAEGKMSVADMKAALLKAAEQVREDQAKLAEAERDARMNDEMLKAAVDRFLSWKLPATFHPDCGISFDGRGKDARGFDKGWPVGTNLFTADEARAMLAHCLEYLAADPSREG